jgi:hypothetical protein
VRVGDAVESRVQRHEGLRRRRGGGKWLAGSASHVNDKEGTTTRKYCGSGKCPQYTFTDKIRTGRPMARPRSDSNGGAILSICIAAINEFVREPSQESQVPSILL